MTAPSAAVYYFAYEQLKVAFGSKDGQKKCLMAPALAGGVARTIVVTLTCPVELIRTKLQSQPHFTFADLSRAACKAVQQNGMRFYCWRGVTPMLLHDVPFSVLIWMSYEL